MMERNKNVVHALNSLASRIHLLERESRSPSDRQELKKIHFSTKQKFYLGHFRFPPMGSKRKSDDICEEEFPLDTLRQRRAFATVIQGILNKIVQYVDAKGIVPKADNADELDITDAQKREIINTLTYSEKAHYRAFDRAMPLGHMDHKAPTNNFFTCFPDSFALFRPQPSMQQLESIIRAAVTSTQHAAGVKFGNHGTHQIPKTVLADFTRLCRPGSSKLCQKCWEAGHYQNHCCQTAIKFPALELNKAYMTEPDHRGYCKQVGEFGKYICMVRQQEV